MKLVKSYLTKNPCYLEGKKIKPKGIILYSSGCSQPSAKVFINNWNRPTYTRACVHGFIDANDGTIYQTLPWDHRGWHIESNKTEKAANSTHIAIEMCEPAQIKYSNDGEFTISDANYNSVYKAVKKTYDSAVELFAFLCSEYHLDPFSDIISSKEGSMKGLCSDRGDPERLWNKLGMKYTMTLFRKDVKEEMEKSQNGSKITFQNENKEKETLISKSYRVKVEVSNLNIRLGPSSSHSPIGRYAPVGVSTITEIVEGPGSNHGWGKLESGEGWISLDYAKLMIGSD